MLFNGSNYSQAANLMVADNVTSATGSTRWTGSQVVLGSGDVGSFRSAVSSAITSYAKAGFTIVASQETFLGPGQRGGYFYKSNSTWNIYTTKQHGGAMVATRYDSNGDPVEIAHLITGFMTSVNQDVFGNNNVLLSKGGGGGNQTDQKTAYDPNQAADILKSKFVDRSNLFGINLAKGSLGYSAPMSLRVGNGGFPYELSASMEYHPAPSNFYDFGPVNLIKPQPGFTTNWNNDLSMSGSGLEAMGRSDIRAAAGTIAEFLATQDIYKAANSAQREAAAVLAQSWWTDQITGNVVTVSVGTSSRQFLKLANGQWILPGSSYGKVTVTGNRVAYESDVGGATCNPLYQLSRGWDYSGMSFAVTNEHGDTQNFSYWMNTYATNSNGQVCGFIKGFRLTSWNFPFAPTPTLSFAYNPADAYVLPDQGNIDRLSTVTNNLGRTVKFTYVSGSDKVQGFNDNGGGHAYSLAYHTDFQSDFDLDSITDPLLNETSFTYVPSQGATAITRPVLYAQLNQVFTAENTTYPNSEYDYDSLGRVEQVKDAVALQPPQTRAPYEFYIADGTRGERDDPLGQSYTVLYDGYGHPSNYIDEVGSITQSTFDSRGRPMQYLYPENDCEVFGYDDHNNTISFWKVDAASNCNTGAGSTHVLHASASYDQTWNKPLTVKNARGYTTTLTYYGSGSGTSLLHTATRPAITEGTPAYTFTYTSIGKVYTATTPVIGLTTIQTTNGYDSSGNLTSTELDSGTGGLGPTTGYGYNTIGDVTSTTDPNGNVTTSQFDNNRRKTEDDHHMVGGSTAYLNAAEKIQYDAIGRDKEDDAGLTFSTTGTPTVLTWQMVKTTTYTPTSKVYVVTDADSRSTINYYDDDDRISTVKDPALRQTHYHYCAPGTANCAANAVQTEYRGYSSGLACTKSGTLQQCYRRYTYGLDGEQATVEDANSHITSYCYDGFVRLIETDFPDNTGVACQSATDYEKLTLDANGNVTQRQTRAGDLLTYQYNALDWITQKVSPRPALTTNWTYLLDGRIDTVSDTAGNLLDYGYDTAGRQTSVATTMAGFPGGALTTGYTLDANGNRIQLTWPDATSIYYCYDNLNRMTAAYTTSASCTVGSGRLALYTYDPLSRRQNVAYLNGASMAYTYYPSGDLNTLTHSIGGTGPAYTFNYTPAHQLQSEAVSGDSTYVWQPSAAATDAYTAANKLNQYPSWTPSGGSSSGFGYDPNGNMTSGTIGGGAWTFGYDAENRLLTADKTVGGTVHAAYAYDPLGRRTHKSGSGVTEAWFLSDGTDEIFEYNSAGAASRRIVPGPAIDEPIFQATGTGLGTRRYFHTNHQGSVIATSSASDTVVDGPYVYDPYGNCFSNGNPCNSSGEPYRFTGRRFDAETGLLYYRARYYSPVIGRLLQTDPVGYSADMNLYTYVGNDPTDKADPTGEAAACTGNTPTTTGAPPTGSLIPGGANTTDACGATDSSSGQAGNVNGKKSAQGPQWTGTTGTWTAGATGSWPAGSDSGKAEDATLDVLGIILLPFAGPEEAAGKAVIPQVTDRTLGNIVRDLFKGAATSEGRIGTGSTADAVRNELATGLPTRGVFHSEKASQYIRALENWARRNPNASARDKLVAESLKMDLQDAVRGGGASGSW